MEQPNISSDLIRGHIDTIVLNSLLSSDKNVQDITDYISEKSNGEYEMNQATLYSSLKRLESLKEIESYWHSVDGGRRKFFKITEIGKKHVNENLTSWTYSREIIDKLIGVKSSPVYAPVTNENLLNANSPLLSQDKKPEEKPFIENKPDLSQVKTPEEVKDINFRSILNGLTLVTVSSEKQSENTNKSVLEPISSEDVDESEPADIPVAKLYDVIDKDAFNQKEVTKIDFADITLKAAKEGYKVRISSKEPIKNKGTLLINKLNFISALIVMLIAFVEFGSLFLATNVSNLPFITCVTVAILIYPVVASVFYFSKPRLTTIKKVTNEGILSSGIICFNVLIVTTAINVLIGVNFSDFNLISMSFFTPIILSIDVIFFFVIRMLLSKKSFVLKGN